MRVRPCAWLPALAVLACGCANAHSPMPGVGLFYSGMLHPVLVPAHLIAIIALGLWLGQRWPAGSVAVPAFVLAFPLGALAGMTVGWRMGELAVLAVAALIALAAVTARGAPRMLLLLAGAGVGVALGADSLPDGPSGARPWLFLAGVGLGILIGLSWIVVISELARRPWMKIGLRVVASWVCAAAILVLALTWLGPRPAVQPSPAAKGASSVVR